MVIESHVTSKGLLFSSENLTTGGRHNLEDIIIAGVNKIEEIIICHLRIFSIDPDLLSIL